jgi:hypothetical protein
VFEREDGRPTYPPCLFVGLLVCLLACKFERFLRLEQNIAVPLTSSVLSSFLSWDVVLMVAITTYAPVVIMTTGVVMMDVWTCPCLWVVVVSHRATSHHRKRRKKQKTG